MTNRPLNERTDCFYQLPAKTPTAQLKEYETYIKKQYTNYSHRIRNRFFFRFTCTKDRDMFLLTLEQSARKTLIVEREYLQSY